MPAQSQVAEQLVLVVGVGVSALVVGVQAQVVAQAVREEGGARPCVEDLLGITLEDSELQQTVDGHLVRVEVKIIPIHAALDHGGRLLLHAKDYLVDVP